LAQEAIAAFPPARGAIYPSGDAYDLRQALAAKFGKSPGTVSGRQTVPARS